MRVSELVKYLDNEFPLSLQESYDNCGLQVGDGNVEVSGVLLAIDVVEATLDEAVEKGCNFILCHHPLIFKVVKRIAGKNYIERILHKAIKCDIAIYAAHTNADKVLEGVSGAMAARLGLENVTVLDDEGEGTGLGAVGDFPEPMTSEAALALVKERFSLKVVKASRPVEGLVSRVAMCGGSGGSLIAAARRSGAQLYISGDISYHNFFTPEGFMIMDIGHYESEIDIVDILFALITKKFPTFAVRITQNINSNPIYYF